MSQETKISNEEKKEVVLIAFCSFNKAFYDVKDSYDDVSLSEKKLLLPLYAFYNKLGALFNLPKIVPTESDAETCLQYRSALFDVFVKLKNAPTDKKESKNDCCVTADECFPILQRIADQLTEKGTFPKKLILELSRQLKEVAIVIFPEIAKTLVFSSVYETLALAVWEHLNSSNKSASITEATVLITLEKVFESLCLHPALTDDQIESIKVRNSDVTHPIKNAAQKIAKAIDFIPYGNSDGYVEEILNLLLFKLSLAKITDEGTPILDTFKAMSALMSTLVSSKGNPHFSITPEKIQCGDKEACVKSANLFCPVVPIDEEKDTSVTNMHLNMGLSEAIILQYPDLCKVYGSLYAYLQKEQANYFSSVRLLSELKNCCDLIQISLPDDITAVAVITALQEKFRGIANIKQHANAVITELQEKFRGIANTKQHAKPEDFNQLNRLLEQLAKFCGVADEIEEKNHRSYDSYFFKAHNLKPLESHIKAIMVTLALLVDSDRVSGALTSTPSCLMAADRCYALLTREKKLEENINSVSNGGQDSLEIKPPPLVTEKPRTHEPLVSRQLAKKKLKDKASKVVTLESGVGKKKGEHKKKVLEIESEALSGGDAYNSNEVSILEKGDLKKSEVSEKVILSMDSEDDTMGKVTLENSDQGPKRAKEPSVTIIEEKIITRDPNYSQATCGNRFFHRNTGKAFLTVLGAETLLGGLCIFSVGAAHASKNGLYLFDAFTFQEALQPVFNAFMANPALFIGGTVLAGLLLTTILTVVLGAIFSKTEEKAPVQDNVA